MKQFGNLGAVLWDMDGVVVDSKNTHLAAFEQVLSAHGWGVPKDIFTKSFGMTNEKVIKNITNAAMDAATAKVLALEKDVIFRQMIFSQARHVNGVSDWMAQVWSNSGTILHCPGRGNSVVSKSKL